VPSTGVRQQNLAGVLTLLHRYGPLTRAALTEATGLNRSTIGDLVGALGELGLAEEGPPDPERRVGRPSPVVAVSPRTVAIAANPEVDALTLAAVGLDQSIVVRERIELEHPWSPEETAQELGVRLKTWRRRALRRHRIVAVGLAVPGLVRTTDGEVRVAPHLGWRGVAIGPLVEAATGLPASVGNDATLGAQAEHLFGAARGVSDVVYLNGGASGIGGGIIAGGIPLGGAGGYAGEFGQNHPGFADPADRRAPGGVLEDEVNRGRLLAVLGLPTADDHAVGAAITEVADCGGGAVSSEVGRQRRVLATALASTVNGLNPSVIVLGGFLAILAARDLDGFAASVRAQSMSAAGEQVEIRLASLADDRLLVGAAELAFTGLLSDPATVLASTLGARR
jgi:predicted NBD/HSP70 family sugar kinase